MIWVSDLKSKLAEIEPESNLQGQKIEKFSEIRLLQVKFYSSMKIAPILRSSTEYRLQIQKLQILSIRESFYPYVIQ